MKKHLYNYILIVVELLLLAGIIVFLTMTVNSGNLAKDMIYVYPVSRVFMIASTAVAFLFALGYYIFKITGANSKNADLSDNKKIKNERADGVECVNTKSTGDLGETKSGKMHLILLFLLFATIADVFFNTLDDNTYGFIAFIAAYAVIGAILYKKKYEWILRFGLIIFLLVGIYMVGRLKTVGFAIQVIACAMLAANFIILMINHFKYKNNYGSYFMTAMVLQLISDAALFFRTVTMSMPVASNICSYIVWITYIAANVCFVFAFVTCTTPHKRKQF